MGEGGGKLGVVRILEPPSICRMVRKTEQSRIHTTDHGRRNLEARWIKGEARAQRLDERFLQRPEPVEQANLVVGAGRKCCPFAATEHRLGNPVEIATRSTMRDQPAS